MQVHKQSKLTVSWGSFSGNLPYPWQCCGSGSGRIRNFCRIRSDPKLFAGSGSRVGSGINHFGAGSKAAPIPNEFETKLLWKNSQFLTNKGRVYRATLSKGRLALQDLKQVLDPESVPDRSRSWNFLKSRIQIRSPIRNKSFGIHNPDPRSLFLSPYTYWSG